MVLSISSGCICQEKSEKRHTQRFRIERQQCNLEETLRLLPNRQARSSEHDADVCKVDTYGSGRGLTTRDEGDKVWSTSRRTGPREGYRLTLDQSGLVVSMSLEQEWTVNKNP